MTRDEQNPSLFENGAKSSPKEKRAARITTKRPECFRNIQNPQWTNWHWHVRNQITTAAELDRWIALTVEEKRAIQFSQGRFHFSLTPYWASLMDPNDFFCPIRRQAVPVDDEFRTSIFELPDAQTSGVKLADGRLVHDFPERAQLVVHSQCVMYCRFCPQRKITDKKVSQSSFPHYAEFPTLTREQWQQIEAYLIAHPQIHEIVITGGEPLLLNDDLLREIFTKLKSIPSVKTLRLETRIVSVLPQRVTSSLLDILKEFQPIYLILHVNHPAEITPEFIQACTQLVDSGVPLASETVLLHEINDRVQTLSDLFSTLLKLRVRPYRLIQSLPAHGTEHFRTTISMGMRLVEALRSKLNGLALPEYVVDTAGGKVPLRYESILSRSRKRVLLKNFEGKVFVYPEKIFSFSS